MNGKRKARSAPVRRAAAIALGAATLIAASVAIAHGPGSPVVTVDVYDRTAGVALDVYAKDGRRYVIGVPGHEYAVRIRNDSPARILAVASVDGVNVVSGETASPDQSGYVIDAGGNVAIEGWRTSLRRTSAFYFTDLGDSYAARTGRPANVGVIGVAVFRERVVPIADRAPKSRIAADSTGDGRADAPATAAAPDAAPQEREAQRPAAEAGSAGGDFTAESRRLAARLGTGFGRGEASPAQRVRFERATDTPAETVVIRYDRRENLVAMGVLPAPRYAQRVPDPFPALRFVAPPR